MSAHTPSLWEQIVAANPDHSHWYIQRFRDMAAAGADLDGEARFIDAMLARGSRVLDGGCGPGRVGAKLASLGHTVVGVDVDPVLIAAAKEDHPGPQWLVEDLCDLDLPARGIADGFDAIVVAGNVMTFLAQGTHVQALGALGRHLAPGGRLVLGFGLGRGYEIEALEADVATAGLVEELRLGTWDLRPFTARSDFVVTVLTAA